MISLSPLVLALSTLAVIVAPADVTALDSGGTRDVPLPASDAEALPALELQIDRSKVDLVAHRFELKMSRAAKSVRLRVLDADGNVIARDQIAFNGERPGTPLTIAWTPESDAPVARVEVWGYDTFGYYAGVAIIPWSIRVPHEEVLFDTAKAIIKASEEAKLEASYGVITKAMDEHKKLGPIVLFIVGHTDRVGTESNNLTLSRHRARAIAAWFKKRGLTTPIAYQGFGESVPAVKTADGVDEPRNRRVDYILAIEPPAITKSGPTTWHHLDR